MPPKRKPTKEDIKSAADRAEKKKGAKTKKSALDPPVVNDDDELEEMPGGILMRRPRRMRGGRPPKYKPEYAKIAKAMVARGSTIAELADVFDVANSTIHLWQVTYDEFKEAFIEINSEYDNRIERSLAERALGYTFDAVKVFNYKGEPVIVPYREHVPPDIAAIKLWLAKRRPEKWQEREEIKVSGDEVFLELWKRLGSDKKSDDTKG